MVNVDRDPPVRRRGTKVIFFSEHGSVLHIRKYKFPRSLKSDLFDSFWAWGGGWPGVT